MHALLFNLLIFTLTSCGTPPGQKEIANLTSFKLQGLTLNSQKDISTKNSFPKFEKEYHFSVQVLDVGTDLAIPNTKFVVDLEEEGKKNITSDVNGVVRWSEKLAYYLTNDKKQICVKRKISAYDNKEKSQQLLFYLYPYATHLNETISEFSVDAAVLSSRLDSKVEASKTKLNQTKIELKNARVEFKYLGVDQEGARTRVNIAGEVFAEISKYNNEPYDYILNSGSVLIYLELIDTSGNAFYKKEIDEVEILNKKLNVSYVDYIKYSEKFENISLNINVVPVSLGSRFESFYGQHKIGMFFNFFEKHDLIFEYKFNGRLSNFKFSKAKNAMTSLDQGKILRFDKLTLEYDMIEDGETPTTRTIIYRSKTCVTDYYQDKKLAFDEFSITKTTGEIVVEQADSEGCLYWNEMIKFKYYRPENFYKRTNVISHVSSGISKKVTSYINPWTILTIGRDEREMDKATIDRINARTDVFSRLFLEEYSFETIGVTYHLDEFMTLFVRKNILLDLEFEVTRYSSLTDGINAKEDIRDGVYLLKVALEKSYIDTRKSYVDVEQRSDTTFVKKSVVRKPIEYIYVVSKLVRVWNGHIITPIELSIHDLRLMTVRSNFLVQIQPIDQELLDLNKNFDIKDINTDRVISILKEKFPNEEPRLELLAEKDSGLPTRTFTGPMILLEMEGGADVRPTDAINVCHTDDCNFLEKDNDALTKRKFSHDQKYFGSINHLIDKTVDDLQDKKKILDMKYGNQLKIESSMSNYLETFKLNLVSGDDRDVYSLPKTNDEFMCHSADISDCFVKSNSRRIKQESFLELINSKDSDNQISSISEIINISSEQMESLGKKLCFRLVRDREYQSNILGHNLFKYKIRKNALWNKLNILCNSSNSYSFNRLIKTEGVEEFSFLGGKTINFDLGSANSVEYSEAFSTNVEVGGEINPFGFFGDKVSSIVGGGISLSGASETGFSYGDSSGLTSNTYLAMQRATFDIKFKKPLHCMELRIRPAFLKKLKHQQSLFPDFKIEMSVLEEGYLICDGETSNRFRDAVYRERFYYFAQHFTEGHMLDDGSILNHPWLLGLRGERDYTVFVHLLGLKPNTSRREIGPMTTFFQKASGWYLDDQESLSQSFNQNDLAALPLDQISNAFENVLPSFPGIYNLRVEKKEYPYD